MNFTRNLSRMAKSLLNQSMKQKQQQQPFTVIVEGNIGSGKTTFLEHFKRLENITVMSEPIEMWRNCHGYNLLNKMYEDPKKWSFTFQSYVQLTMIKSHLYQPPLPLSVDESKKSIKLMERSIYSARYCFVEKLFKDNVLAGPSLAVIDEWFKWLTTTQNYRVDLIVYLRTTPHIVYERIKQRNRIEEKLLPYEYIKELHEIHENWLFYKRTHPIPAPVMVIDADLDLAVIEEEYGRCESQILQQATVSL